MTFDLPAIQQLLQNEKIDGWLIYIFRNQNPLANSILNLPDTQIRSRRCFYWIPATGTPIKLQHQIEPFTLEHLPGDTCTYLSYLSLSEKLQEITAEFKCIAMEYSPSCAIPTVSLVDAGTFELVRQSGVQITSSANLVQSFDATLNDEQLESHLHAASVCYEAAHAAFAEVERIFCSGGIPRETEIQKFIMNMFDQNGLCTDHPPIVASGSHAGNPHYIPYPEEDAIKKNEVLLIDLWAKGQSKGCVYADQTWMGFVGNKIPDAVNEAWNTVRDARRSTFDFICDAFKEGRKVQGWEADQVARDVIAKAGFAEYFIHRTGHSIGVNDHANGANLDNLESKELRNLIPRTIFSIEPGVYFKEFGIRSENNVLITERGHVMIADNTDQEDMILIKTTR
jgi:Xaa-Pro dipeptidase